MKYLYVLLALFLTGCQAASLQADEPESFEVVDFTSDRQVYSSHEDITFTVSVTSPEDTEITAVIKGIRPYNRDYIEVEETHNLVKGENTLSFSAKTPYCTSGCGGVHPGNYDITIELFRQDEPLASNSLVIELVR